MATPVDNDTATCLLTGIVTDTRGFRTSNVTTGTMAAALRLMRAGGALTLVTRQALNRHSVPMIHVWGAALSRATVEERILWTAIPLEAARAVSYQGDGDAGLASFLADVEDTDAVAVFVEREHGHVEVGLRASPGFDVSRVALHFGGGGHALAAGCSLIGPLEQAQRSVLAALHADFALQRQRHAQRDSEPQQAPRPDVA
jgi:phosphoesterase RecJ-like protein